MARWPRAQLALAAIFLSGAVCAQSPTPHQQLARDIYRELIEIRTVHPDGDNTAAARVAARYLLDAGFDPKDVEVLEPAPRKGNLVARLRGTGELKPVLLLAHIDVVEAKKEDWSDGLDPFRLTEKGGYFYGRGTIDDKAQAAIFIANLVRARKAGWKPKRDVIVALTADEEGGTHNGVAWLIANRRDAIDAEFAINEGGNLETRGGKPHVLAVQVSEKIPFTYELAATNAGGHSSLPRPDNAIYDLTAALERLSRHGFPARNATDEKLRLAKNDPSLNAQLRTTCVATRLEAGHASNALPQTAKATVNCRMLPNESAEDLQATLVSLAGERVAVKALYKPKPSPPSDPDSKVMKTIARVTADLWPGVAVTPIMSAGATDGSRLRVVGIPVYGVAGIAMEVERMHGRDERLAVHAFDQAIDFLDRLVRALASEE